MRPPKISPRFIHAVLPTAVVFLFPMLAAAQYIGPDPYLAFDDPAAGTAISPFAALQPQFSYFHLEDFEDGALNTPGVTVREFATTNITTAFSDSVDGDDGTIDGVASGNAASLFSNLTTSSFTFDFDAATLGTLPTHAGIVWTDVGANFGGPPPAFVLVDNVEFEAFDAMGASLGTFGPFSLGDNSISRTTDEDRFLGIINPGGISAIQIRMPNLNNWEVDHLQYGAIVPPMPPTAVDDTYPIQQGQSLSISAPGVLANDTDPNNDPLTVTVVTGPSRASSFSLNGDGSFTYTPDASFTSGTDSFTYTASDGTGTSNTATVTLQFANSPPQAADDAYQTDVDVSISVNAPGVLANDSDANNDPLTATLASGPSSAAAFQLNSDGSFSYTPQPGFTGTDTFTYTASDGVDTSNIATVTITVLPDPLDCLFAIRQIVDDYETLVETTLAQQIPAIGALLQAGDQAGAIALQQATTTMLVQEAGVAVTAVQAECASCAAQLQATGDGNLVPQLETECKASVHRVGAIQARAVARLEAIITPPNPSPVAMAVRNRYIQEIRLNAERAVLAMNGFEARYGQIIDRHLSAGRTALAGATMDSAQQVVHSSNHARICRIIQLCEAFVAKAKSGRMPNSSLLIVQVTQAAELAIAEIQLAEDDMMQVLRSKAGI